MEFFFPIADVGKQIRAEIRLSEIFPKAILSFSATNLFSEQFVYFSLKRGRLTVFDRDLLITWQQIPKLIAGHLTQKFLRNCTGRQVDDRRTFIDDGLLIGDDRIVNGLGDDAILPVIDLVDLIEIQTRTLVGQNIAVLARYIDG